MTRQVAAEGVERIAIVSDDPGQAIRPARSGPPARHLPPPRRSRRGAARAPRGARLSVLIYDQTCAAEKRRRRKRGSYPDPGQARGDQRARLRGLRRLRRQSNCVSVQPLETEFGRKRRSTSRPATRTFPASRASARASSPCMAHAPKKALGTMDDFALGADLPEPKVPAHRSQFACSSPASAAPASSPSARSSAWPRISRARARHDRHGGPRPEGRPGDSHVRIAPTPDEIHAIRVRRAGRSRARLRHHRHRLEEGRWARSTPTAPTSSSTPPRPTPGEFTRDADFSLPTRSG
jgi:indolepyruvate ferredoxin oxidoreductase